MREELNSSNLENSYEQALENISDSEDSSADEHEKEGRHSKSKKNGVKREFIVAT